MRKEPIELKVVSQQSLYSEEHINSMAAGGTLGINNFITGIAQLGDPDATGFTGLKGNHSSEWQSFFFKVPTPGNTILSATTSIGLLGISNTHIANDMNYFFKEVTSSISGTDVVVNSQVMIGDGDGWLGQLGFTCIVAYG